MSLFLHRDKANHLHNSGYAAVMGAIRMRVQTADKNMVPHSSQALLPVKSSIYNIAFSSENIISAESGEKYAQIKQKQSKAVLIKCQWILMWEDNRQLFHWRRRYYGLWTSIFISSDGLNLKHVTYGFILLQTCSFSIDNKCVWIIVIFLSAVWFSFWRHPFIAEDPLVNK